MRGKHLAHTLILTLGVGLHVVDGFMVAAIMPSVVADIGGAAFYTWSAMVYTVTATLGTACGGLAAAVLGLRQASLIGVLLLLLGNAGAAISPTMVVLLVARAVQGLGGGLLVAQAYGMASAFYPDTLRARVLTTISVAHGLAALVGPIAGGGFATIGWWRGAFWVAVPVLMVLAGLMWRFLPALETEDQAVSLPLLRLTLLGAAVLGVAASGQVGSLVLRLACVASAVILVKLTLRLDAGAATRLFPTRPFSVTHVVGTALPIILLFTLTPAHTGAFMPLVVQVLHGIAPLWAGYFQAVLALSWTTAAVASASLEGRSVRRAILVGPLLVLTGVLGQAFLVVDGSLTLLAVCVAMTGAGMGLCFAHISSWTMSAARTGEANVTASAIPTMGSLGRGFGAATAGLVANAAGMGAGISPETVASAAAWVYGLAVAVPAVVVMLSFRLLALTACRCDQS